MKLGEILVGLAIPSTLVGGIAVFTLGGGDKADAGTEESAAPHVFEALPTKTFHYEGPGWRVTWTSRPELDTPEAHEQLQHAIEKCVAARDDRDQRIIVERSKWGAAIANTAEEGPLVGCEKVLFRVLGGEAEDRDPPVRIEMYLDAVTVPAR